MVCPPSRGLVSYIVSQFVSLLVSLCGGWSHFAFCSLLILQFFPNSVRSGILNAFSWHVFDPVPQHDVLNPPTVWGLRWCNFTSRSKLYIFCTPHSTLYTPHSTLPTLHSTLYTLHSTLYTPHFTLYTPHFTLYTRHSTLYSTLSTPHSTLYTFHSTLQTGNRGNMYKIVQINYCRKVFCVTAYPRVLTSVPLTYV